jgi:alpha-ketoglutarate-dependent taurine dioxygenase
MTKSSPADSLAMRRRVALSSREQVSVAPSPHSILSIITSAIPTADLEHWIRNNRTTIEELLSERGALLFRGFQVTGPGMFQDVVRAWSPVLLSYVYGSTPRSRSAVAGVYTSTEYPADQSIPQHNEMSYARMWPRHLWFYCHTAAAHGGTTPLADSRRIGMRLDRDVLAAFADRGVRYTRNYGTGFDLSWQQAFETESRADVEALCRTQDIEFTWIAETRLRTSQVCQAVAVHPETGAEVWFNQAHLFHTSALPADVRAGLWQAGQGQTPREAYYGDGAPIPDAALDQVRAAYSAEIVREPWHDGDVLLIDNMLVAHGRDPYRGPRRVLVAMSNEHRVVAGGQR